MIQWLVVRWNYPSRRCTAKSAEDRFMALPSDRFVLDHF
jgi:hypothetical protein